MWLRRGPAKYPAMEEEATEWVSTEESRELAASISLRAIWGRGGRFLSAEAWASSISFSDTLECHSTMSGSGIVGSTSRGKMLGNGAPSTGFIISNLFTAFCRKGTCSSGSSSSWTVCHLTKPWGVRAGVEGGL